MASGASAAAAASKASAAAAAQDDGIPWETLLKVRRCFAYQVPVTDGHISVQCESWGLEKPIFTGELHVLAKNHWLHIRLIADGATFADTVWLDCSTVNKPTPLEAFIDNARDSSRYFVIRVGDTPGPKPRRVVPIGIGFRERNHAFDLTASIRDRVAQVQRGETPDDALKRLALDDAKETAEAEARLAASTTDLSLKAGQRIKVNFKAANANDDNAAADNGNGDDDDGFGSFTSASSTSTAKKPTVSTIPILAAKGGGLMLAPPPDLESSLAELERGERGRDDDSSGGTRKEKKKKKKSKKKAGEDEDGESAASSTDASQTGVAGDDDFGDFTSA